MRGWGGGVELEIRQPNYWSSSLFIKYISVSYFTSLTMWDPGLEFTAFSSQADTIASTVGKSSHAEAPTSSGLSFICWSSFSEVKLEVNFACRYRTKWCLFGWPIDNFVGNTDWKAKTHKYLLSVLVYKIILTNKVVFC